VCARRDEDLFVKLISRNKRLSPEVVVCRHHSCTRAQRSVAGLDRLQWCRDQDFFRPPSECSSMVAVTSMNTC